MSRVLLRGAHVITMTPDRPDAEQVDILVDGETIAAVGENIEAPDAEVVDFSGRVIIPGLVNAHLHTWQTALRSAGADWTLTMHSPPSTPTRPSRDCSRPGSAPSSCAALPTAPRILLTRSPRSTGCSTAPSASTPS
ncbi:hypothetical protein ACWCV9_30440 [Streptomyces sp. NPDC001606]